ncbi:MAG TPA: SPFH domain-containing protein, partial [Kineosporiaceae bacterium]|nr:SPFH domain-containing protein [Kineosporiaceae bacterium]
MAHFTVHEGQKAVVRVDGRTAAVLGAGRHELPRRPWRGTRDVRVVDVRRQLLLVAGQELATTDLPGVRVTVVAAWQVADPVAFLEVAVDPVDQLRLAVQLALRDAVAARDLAALTAGRDDLAAELLAAVRPRAAGVGVDVERVEVRDVTPPGEVRRALLAVQTARQDGLAALERARGETAALRALANGAKTLVDNPALVQLRTAQVVAQAGGEVVLRL